MKSKLSSPLFTEATSVPNIMEEPPFKQDDTVAISGEPLVLPADIAEEATQYGIDALKAKNLVGNLPQITAERDELSKQYDEIIRMDIEDPKTAKLAKELRIMIRDNRTKGIQIWHKTTKDYFLKGGQFVDAIRAKEVVVNERMEVALEKIEKHAQIKLEQERQELREKRTAELTEYKEFVPFGVDLGVISDSEYMKVFNGAKLQYEYDLKQKQEAEEARIREQQKEQEKEARVKKLLPYKLYIPDFDTINFYTITEAEMQQNIDDAKALYEKKKAEYEESQKLLAEVNRKKAIRDNRAKELQPYIVFILAYNGLIEMEEEAYQKEFADIKKGAELQWEHDAEQRKKEEDDKIEQQRKSDELKKKNDDLQKQLKEQQEADKKKEKERLAEEKRLKNASDTVILNDIADKIMVYSLSFREVKSDEAKAILTETDAYLKKIADNIRKQTKEL
jgi:predicted RNase H-like HicB family nuclease